MGKNQDPESGSWIRSGIPDHISESLETIFGLKIQKFVDVDPDLGSGIRNLFDSESGIRDGKIRIRDGKIRI
jgi:hypothetical protein